MLLTEDPLETWCSAVSLETGMPYGPGKLQEPEIHSGRLPSHVPAPAFPGIFLPGFCSFPTLSFYNYMLL